jgi:hypothetical protein
MEGRTVVSDEGAIPIRHTDPSQEQDRVQRIAADVKAILTANEDILYVALQTGAGAMSRADAVVATSNRIVFYRRPVIGSANFVDLHWQDVKDVALKQGMMAADLIVETTDGRAETMDWLQKDQAKRIYGIAQQLEQEWREKRRVREMEEARARAGGHVIQAAPAAAPSAEDPVEKLARAKAMLDQGLISETEYDTVKARILSSM